MKIISKKSEYAKNVVTVELTDEERKLSDDELITLADNDGRPNQARCHFGGIVKNKFSKETIITVWID